MKDDQGGDMTEDKGGLLGLLDVLVSVGCEPQISRVPQPPPRWGSLGRSPVAKHFR